jgi:hypothetical protein
MNADFSATVGPAALRSSGARLAAARAGWILVCLLVSAGCI